MSPRTSTTPFRPWINKKALPFLSCVYTIYKNMQKNGAEEKKVHEKPHPSGHRIPTFEQSQFIAKQVFDTIYV